MNMPQPKKAEAWEEEFEKLWTVGSIGTQILFGRFSTAKDIEKSFIRSTLEAERARMVGVLEGKKRKLGSILIRKSKALEAYVYGYNDGIDDAIKSIETKE